MVKNQMKLVVIKIILNKQNSRLFNAPKNALLRDFKSSFRSFSKSQITKKLKISSQQVLRKFYEKKYMERLI